jgi:hypothetical protein
VRMFLAYDATSNLLLLPVYLAACLGLGWLAAWLVETPFLRLRDKFYPASSVRRPIKMEVFGINRVPWVSAKVLRLARTQGGPSRTSAARL